MRMYVGQEKLCETGFNVGISDEGFMKKALRLLHVYIPSFMNIRIVVQVVLRFLQG
jgi:hypothetical protein